MKKIKSGIVNKMLAPIVDFLNNHSSQSKKNEAKSRKGFTLIEVIIAMVLLAVVFATFMMAIVGVQSANRRSASITDFMFETSQKNVDTKIDKITNYLELKAEIKALQKRYDKIISDPTTYPLSDYGDVIESLTKRIQAKETELQDMEEHYQVMQHLEDRTLTFAAKIDRTVEAYEFTSDLTDYKKANVTLKDAQGNKIEGGVANTDNEFYSFGKLSGNTNLYYLFAGDVPIGTVPDPVIFKDNKPEYAYLGETIRAEYTIPPENYDYQFFNYWHLSDSRVAGLTADEASELVKSARPLYSERRHYKDQDHDFSFSYLSEEWIQRLENRYCPVFRYEKLVSEKENTIVVKDFKKQAGAFLAMGIQPARGTVGAAFPIQMSPSETYVVPIANMKNLNKHYSPNMIAMTSSGENTHNIAVKQMNMQNDHILSAAETKKPGLTTDGAIFNIMKKGKPEDAVVAPGAPHIGKYESQFIPIWPEGSDSPYKEVMSIYPRQDLNNYEELQEKGRSDPMNEGRATLMKIKSNFGDNDSKYQSVNVFKLDTQLNVISEAVMSKELQEGSNKNAVLPYAAESKVMVMNNMGLNAIQLDNSKRNGIVFLKFLAADLCDARKAIPDNSVEQEIMEKITSSSLTKRVLKNIREEIPQESSFKKWDKDRYLCDLIRVGFEDRKNNPSMNEKHSVPMFALSYAYKTEPYVDADGNPQIAFTAPLVLRYPGHEVNDNYRAQNGTKFWFQRPGGAGLVTGEFGRNDKDISRIDKKYKRFNKIPSTLIEPDKLNTITMIYSTADLGHNYQKRMMFSIYINGIAAGSGEMYFRHNYANFPMRSMVISFGGIGNLNLVEAIHYSENNAFNILNGISEGLGQNSLRLPMQRFNNNQMGDFKQVQAYAELPDADGLLLDLLKEHKLREFEDLPALFPEN